MKTRTIRPGPGIPMMQYESPNERKERKESNQKGPADVAETVETPSQYIDIPVDLIHENPFAPRTIYTHEMIESLALDIQANGQYEPIKVIEHPDDLGRYMHSDGRTRTEAIKQYRLGTTVRAEVLFGLTPREAALRGYRMNSHRYQMSDYDKAQFMQRLEEDGMEPEQVREALGLGSRMQASRLRAFLKLAPEIIELILSSKDRIGANAATALLDIQNKQGVQKAIRAATTYCDEDVPLKWLQALGKKETLPEEKTALPRQTVQQLKGCTGQYRRNGSRIKLDLELPDRYADEAAKRIEAIFLEYEEHTKAQNEHEGES